jgi:predicted TPR repeat methyltransferase
MKPLAQDTRELTLDEAVAVAILLQKNEQFAQAGEVYRRVLEVAPDHADALHYAGVVAYQQGRGHEAVALIEKSLALAPDQAQCHNNLGVIYQSTGKLESAVQAYRRALAIDPGHANAHNNLGVLLKATEHPAEAEAAYRTAIELDPSHVDAYTNLGILLSGLKRTQEAAACYCKAITLRPKHRDARKLLALAHCTLGEREEAIKIFHQWLEEEPQDPIALHMLAACSGASVPTRASDGFIERTFDSFAATFESKLERLSYRAPVLVATMLELAKLERSGRLDVLDAGCGTGLCGPLVAPLARRLIGVDLSTKMLEQARAKHVYHELVKAELTDFLRENDQAFDVIVSADALVYFGDLSPAVDAVARALRPGGVAVFTLEHACGGGEDFSYRLEHHGRYSHGRRYIEELLSSAGLTTEVAEAELRMESGAPVAGLVVRGTKPVQQRHDL